MSAAGRCFVVCASAGPCLAVIDMQDLDAGRCGQNLAERVHPVAGLLARSDTARAELIELIEAGQLDLELQRRTLAATAGQWHEQLGVETVAARRLDLAADEVDRAPPVDRQKLIGKPRQIHVQLLLYRG